MSRRQNIVEPTVDTSPLRRLADPPPDVDQSLLQPLSDTAESLNDTDRLADPNVDPEAVENSDLSNLANVPRLDIVRVDPRGSTVIAGRAAAREQISVVLNGEPIYETVTDASGEFVVIFDQTFTAGAHQIWVESNGDSEGSLRSDTAVILISEHAPQDPSATAASQDGSVATPIVATTTQSGLTVFE